MAELFQFRHGCTEVKLLEDKGRRRSVYLRPHLTTTVDGVTFLNVNTKASSIKTVVCSMVRGTAKAWEHLSNTDVVEQLSALKRSKFKQLAMDGSAVKRYRADMKAISAKLLTMPDIIVINAPNMYGVIGIDIKFLRKRGL